MRALAHLLGGLLLTVALELPVAAIFGFRRTDELVAVALASGVSYPMLSLASAFVPAGVDGYEHLLWIAGLEIAVVVAEWKLLVYALRGPNRALLTSCVMNAVSFSGGLVFFRPC